jgi:phosphopantothenoylcysteine decarboxylase/phosphopantothenate--cysteine ligase
VFTGKKILVGVTGGIAAYKVAFLVRELVKNNAEVRVIMTPTSVSFITPLTLATLSKNPVAVDFFDEETGEWENHVELGMWADLFLITPLTANTLSHLANGTCDNLLLATYLSAKCPVMVAPAMDLDMYSHPTTEQNLEKIISNGVQVIPAESGELASGLIGPGRMAEIDHIVKAVKEHFYAVQDLKGKVVLVTAGPTYEGIDPVRFIGNRSTGKMGFAIAKEAAKRGAHVKLLMGPTKIDTSFSGVETFSIQTAEELLEQVKMHFPTCDIGVFSAAVSDYRPKEVADQKIKKNDEEMTITLVKNPDTLLYAGSVKKEQILVGFALETNNELEYAKKKIEKKNLDFIVLNSLRDKGAGFGGDTNKVKMISKQNKIVDFELKSKAEVAKDIFNVILEKDA